MTEKPPIEDSDRLSESDADARLKQVVGNPVNAPHKPYKQETNPTKAKLHKS